MEQYIEELFRNVERHKIESFIRHMNRFKEACYTNESEEFIRDAKHEAEKLLKVRDQIAL